MKVLCSNMFIFLLFYFSTSKPSPIRDSQNLAKPGCSSQCGDLIVQYPFGIGTNCSLNVGFTIYCDTSLRPVRAFLNEDRGSWIKLLSDSVVHLSIKVEKMCIKDPDKFEEIDVVYNYTDKPLTYSDPNTLTIIGCNYSGWLSSSEIYERRSMRCETICQRPKGVGGGKFSGKGFCQIPLSKHVKSIRIYVLPLQNPSDIRWMKHFNQCGLAFVGATENFKLKGIHDLTYTDSLIRSIEDTVPVVFDWAIDNLSCLEAKKTHAFACIANSLCIDSTSSGYRCICGEGYDENPYLSPGCQDVNECDDSRRYPCYGKCFNTKGNYSCTCLQGMSGDAHKINGCQHIHRSKTSLKIYIIIVLVLVILSLACGVGSYCVMRRRKLARRREKFFQANGGVLLEQKMNSQGCHEAMTLFTQQQLLKATNNYSKEYILGRGAHGILYKGVLSDKSIVAIKKSKVVDATQVEQFINEVLILTQIIHPNVVKFLGCCLEVEVPILVYEYIPNNTLFHHIHHTAGGMSWLSWAHRLRIAGEVASAVAYLHSETIIPIIHRDIKSSNILLDANYTTKVSDFGASRLVPLDHDHVTTVVQGTLGYLDPEYFQTSQLTQKSDVYSFGVVLAELITNKKHICFDRENKENHLATYFVNSIKENRLLTIVEPRILNEGSLEQLLAIGDLVNKCLNLEGHNRPTMKEIVVELHRLRKLTASTSQVFEVEQHDIL